MEQHKPSREFPDEHCSEKESLRIFVRAGKGLAGRPMGNKRQRDDKVGSLKWRSDKTSSLRGTEVVIVEIVKTEKQ